MFPRIIELFHLKDIYNLIFSFPIILAMLALVYFFKKRVKGFKLINGIVANINVLSSLYMILWLLSSGMHYIYLDLACYGFETVELFGEEILSPSPYETYCINEYFVIFIELYLSVILLLNLMSTFTSSYVAYHCFNNTKLKKEYIDLQN